MPRATRTKQALYYESSEKSLKIKQQLAVETSTVVFEL